MNHHKLHLSVFLPFAIHHRKQVVASPSLNSPERSEGDGRCWANLQNTHFSGLTRKNPVFERSVLKYVSIKNRILTPSGQKSRVCVNQPDRLLHPFKVEILSASRLPKPQKQKGMANQPERHGSLTILPVNCNAVRPKKSGLRKSA